MSQVNDYIQITALIDGTTLNASLRVDNAPLIQRYNPGTTQYVPDFETLDENAKPVVVLIVRDTNGILYNPANLTWRYNGVALTFDADGLCTNSGMAGVMKKIENYSTVIGSDTVVLPALKVVKNLVPLSSFDNDRISVSGQVEVSGSQIDFEEIYKDVIIQESTGNQYDILVVNSVGSQILTKGGSATESLQIYKDGVRVTDLTSFTYQWSKVLATGDTALGTTATQIINEADVDNLLKVRCDVYYNGSFVASGYDQISDFSDLYKCKTTITGISGKTIRNGETATLTPSVVNARTGETVTVSASSWTWKTTDNTGADYTLTGKTGASFTADTLAIPYSDFTNAGMSIGIAVTGNITL